MMAYNREGKIAYKIIDGPDVIEGVDYSLLSLLTAKTKSWKTPKALWNIGTTIISLHMAFKPSETIPSQTVKEWFFI